MNSCLELSGKGSESHYTRFNNRERTTDLLYGSTIHTGSTILWNEQALYACNTIAIIVVYWEISPEDNSKFLQILLGVFLQIWSGLYVL